MSGIPLELIREVQISTRAAAGLSEYNPSAASLPELPPLSAVIADSDPSPSQLRCENCNGRLLRGSESIVCVYCGSGPHYDVVPQPIGFTSTMGYQWLLRSLRLDGSEKVHRTNKREQDQSQSFPKDSASLSGLLNFTVPWPAVTQKEETSSPDKHSRESKRSFSLTGVPPDKFFIKSNGNVLYQGSLEQPVSDNVIGNTSRKADDNQNLFQNFRSLEPAGSSSEQKTGDAFAGWQADFHFVESETRRGGRISSADPGNKFQESESFEAFQFAVSENKQGGRESTENFVGSMTQSGNKFQESASFEAFQFSDSDNKHVGRESSEHLASTSAEPEFQDSESFEDFQIADSENKHGGRKSSENFVGSMTQSGNKFREPESFEAFQFPDSDNKLVGRESSEHLASSSAEPEFQDSESFEDFQFADSENKHGGRESSENFVGSMTQSGNKFQESESFEAFQFSDSDNKHVGRESSEHLASSSAEPEFQDSEPFEDFQFADSENKHGGRESSEHFVGSSAVSGNKFQDSELFEEFQFADSENKHGGRESSKPFAGSSAEPGNKPQDPELFEDFQFASTENQQNGNKSFEHGNKFQGSDLFEPFQFARTENQQGGSKSSESGNKFQDSDLFDHFQFADSKNQPGSHKPSEHYAGLSTEPGNKSQEPELFDDFRFADSENHQDAPKSSEPGYKDQGSDRSLGLEVDLGAHIDSVFGPGLNFNDAKPKHNSTISPAFDTWNSDDFWNNLNSNKPNFAATVSTKDGSKEDHASENSKKDLSTSDDLFLDFQSQSNRTSKPEIKAMNDEHKTEDEDSFEDWNDFTGSTSLNDYQVSTSDQKSSEIDLFSSGEKFEGISQPDLFSTSTTNSNVLPQSNTIMPENHAENWFSDARALPQESGQTLKNEGTSGKSTKDDDDVKKLISEMHDLSFMLKTELSIPPASDALQFPP